MTAENPSAVYVCLNYDEAVCPEQIKARSLCLDGDSGEVLKALQRLIRYFVCEKAFRAQKDKMCA